jgi:hypothetical protein
LIHESRLLGTLAELPAGIYTIGGGHQVGKTTLLKQLMLRLMRSRNVAPKRLAYLTGELLIDGEVKWTKEFRPKDLKQVLKYPNALIAGCVRDEHEIAGIPILPAPVISLRLSRLQIL